MATFGSEEVERKWLRLERLRFEFEHGAGRWSEAQTREIQAIAELLTQTQLKVDAWPRSELRRKVSREIQRVVRISEEMLARSTFAEAMPERLLRDLDIPADTAAGLSWWPIVAEYHRPEVLLEDLRREGGPWAELPWGVRTLIAARLRSPTLNDWWFRKPK